MEAVYDSPTSAEEKRIAVLTAGMMVFVRFFVVLGAVGKATIGGVG